MLSLSSEQRRAAELIGELGYCNPFLPKRIEMEKEILGADYVRWNLTVSKQGVAHEWGENVNKIIAHAEKMIGILHGFLMSGSRVAANELALYEKLVFFILYHDRRDDFDKIIHDTLTGKSSTGVIGFYADFQQQAETLFSPSGSNKDHFSQINIAHLFALFFQIRRAFHHIFECIIGDSAPAAQLRASVWQSIFTHDMVRYQRTLYDRMTEVSCLISGPSGTGKELVARAIGLSRYIPFDAQSRRFAEDFPGSFHPLNISSLSPTLIESELFGHCRNAFTGALRDRKGWFEVCQPHGAIFLDEIGEVDLEIQVKLLRVLETRRFMRIGETEERTFEGKILAATNRNLDEEMHAGRFRKDLYYRLCSDLIVTPSLHEHMCDSPQTLPNLVLHIAVQFLGEEEADMLADEATAWIRSNLGMDYLWPGNFRELEQCVRNIMVRKTYRPVTARGSDDERRKFADAVCDGKLSADEMLSKYITLVYARVGTYQQTARELALDHRTVKSKIDRAWLEKL